MENEIGKEDSIQSDIVSSHKEEEIVSFKKESELMMYGVESYDGTEIMAAITGYNLSISFNMRLINSLADAEACADALSNIFYNALMDKLISMKPNITNQQTEKEQ